jgi:predicted GNAT family acetyltransferase
MPWRGNANLDESATHAFCTVTSSTSPIPLQHNRDASRFEATVDGHLCVCQYRIHGKVLMLTHTGVPTALRGCGIAAQLVHAALDFARSKGLKVRPDCSFAEVYMQRHPETLDLLND